MKNIFILGIFLFLCKSCDAYPSPSNNTIPSVNTSVASEKQEFDALMSKDKLDRNQRSALVVNQFLNDKASDKQAALLIENSTNCDIIVRMIGMKNYKLPIARNNKNYIMVDKGNYTFRSNFCKSKYYSQKRIIESATITLSER